MKKRLDSFSVTCYIVFILFCFGFSYDFYNTKFVHRAETIATIKQMINVSDRKNNVVCIEVAYTVNDEEKIGYIKRNFIEEATVEQFNQFKQMLSISENNDYNEFIIYDNEWGNLVTFANGESGIIYKGDRYINDKIDIYYDTRNPERVWKNDFEALHKIGIAILAGIGLVLLIKFIFNLILYIKDKVNEEYIQIIEAQYVETILKPKKASPYVILCEWVNPDNKEKYVFESEPINFDPTKDIEERKITTFPVHVNMKNMNDYCIDIESIY